MSKYPKSLKLLQKYADKMHKGFCEAAGLDPEETGCIRGLLSNFVDCYYNDMELYPWQTTVTSHLVYRPKEKSIYIDTVIDQEIPKELISEEPLENLKQQFGHKYYLKPDLISCKDKSLCKFTLAYEEKTILISNLKDTVYKVMSQFFSDEIDELLNPIMKIIKNVEEKNNE